MRYRRDTAFVALEGMPVLADDVAELAKCFEDGLELQVAAREEHYVAFDGPGIRFAIFRRALMRRNTGNPPSFLGNRGTQVFELNFECADRYAVERTFRRVVTYGATPIAPPVGTDWGHFTGFFADPEGNIHSLVAVLAH